MTSHWIKWDAGLERKPKVLRLARLLNCQPTEAAGLCMVFWSWADENCTDGALVGATPEDIDAIVGRAGFAEQLEKIGWLNVVDGGAVIPNFVEHNSQSAKRRAVDASRKRVSRKGLAACPQNVRIDADKTRTREEKRREEKTIKDPAKTKTPSADADCEQIYQAYPRHVGPAKAKAAIAKAIQRVARGGCSDAVAYLLGRVEDFAASSAGNAGKFTPHPATWFNQARYEDDPAEWEKTNESSKPASSKPGAEVRDKHGVRPGEFSEDDAPRARVFTFGSPEPPGDSGVEPE